MVLRLFRTLSIEPENLQKYSSVTILSDKVWMYFLDFAKANMFSFRWPDLRISEVKNERNKIRILLGCVLCFWLRCPMYAEQDIWPKYHFKSCSDSK